MDPFSFAVMTVAQIGISYLFPAEGPRLKDLKISASTYGAVIPEAWGTVRVAGNMIWSDQIREHKKKKRVGLKFVKYYTYTGTFAMACCKGPVTQIRKVWANHKLIYDATGTGVLQTKKTYKIRQFLGTEDQDPAKAIEELVGEGNTPAYRGLCYLLFENMELDDFGNSIPQISVEVFVAGDAEDAGVVTRFTALPEAPSGNQDFQLDPVWGYGYSRNASQPPRLRRYQLNDANEDFRATRSVANVYGISPTSGNIVVAGAPFSNSTPIIQLDPITLDSLTYTGENSSSLDKSPTGAEYGAFSTAIDEKGEVTEYMCTISVLDYWITVPTYPLELVGAAERPAIAGESSAGLYGAAYVVGTRDLKKPSFYVWEGGNGSGNYVSALNLYLVTPSPKSASRSLVFSFANPDADDGGFDDPFQARGVHWDPSDGGCLLVWSERNNTFCGKWRRTLNADGSYTSGFVWKKDLSRVGIGNGLNYVQPCVLSDSQIWWAWNNRLFMMDTNTGDWITGVIDPYSEYEDLNDLPAAFIEPPGADWNGLPIVDDQGEPVTVVGFEQQIFDAARRTLYIGRPQYKIGGGAGKRQPVTLGGLIRRLFMRAGLRPGQFDVSALEVQQIRGYGWASQSDLKSIIAQLRMLYLFDIVERSGKLVGVMRSTGLNEVRTGQPVRRLPQALLGSSGDGQGMEYWKETRLQEADIPNRLTLTYMNYDRDMETSTAITKRIVDPVPTMFSRQQVALEMGVVMTGTEAKNQVNKILWSQWAERTQHTSRLPWTYIELDPADVISVKMDDGRTYRERLHQMELGADLGVGVETFTQDPESYISEQQGDGGAPPVTPPYSPARQARPFVYNTPLLRDQDDTGGSYSLYYSAIGHTASTRFDGAGMWRGENQLQYGLLYSTDTDVEWAMVAGIMPAPRHGAHGLDWETRVTLWPSIPWFEIESITDDELWAGANIAIIGAEVIQFRDCVQNIDGSWTIWNLLRGRRGTEYATAAHVRGEAFTFLSNDRIEGDGEVLDATGKTRFFRAVGDGMKLDTAPMVQITYAPRDLMPYAPKDIRRTKNGGGSVTLDWKRRTRMGGNMQDGTPDVPLNEVDERYEVYILRYPYFGDLSRGDMVPDGDFYANFQGDSPLDFPEVPGFPPIVLPPNYPETIYPGGPPEGFPNDFRVIYRATTTTSSLTFNMGELAQKIVSEAPLVLAPYDADVDTIHVLIYQLSSAVGRGFPGVRSIEPWQDF